MMKELGLTALCLALFGASGCYRPAEGRALLDLEVGQAQSGSVSVAADGAHVVSFTGTRLVLWAQSPVFELRIDTPSAVTLEVRVQNGMPGAEFVGDFSELELRSMTTTLSDWQVGVPAQGADLEFGPALRADEPYRIAVMGDIQTGLPEVGEVFAAIAADPTIRFVISTGDLVENAQEQEYVDLLAAFAELPIPYFSTIGNHELAADVNRWPELFGRHTIHFDFQGASFSLVDTGNATIDPLVYEWLEEWLDEAGDRVHIYGQHYPPLDPIGARGGSMNSRKEAAKLLSRLARGRVDATFYGHLHSYYAFENAGIPAYISGGGGAVPERLDGIGRHFLTVDIDPAVGIRQVAVVRVD